MFDKARNRALDLQNETFGAPLRLLVKHRERPVKTEWTHDHHFKQLIVDWHTRHAAILRRAGKRGCG